MAQVTTYYSTGCTLYFLVTNSAGEYYNGSTFESYTAGNYGDYDIALTEDGATGVYRGTFPAIAAGIYDVLIKVQGGGSPAASDIVLGASSVSWNGTLLLSAADAIAISGN